MKVVIMAGGRGTRIAELFPDIPKPLIPIDGVPVLEREICSLREQGFSDFIFTVSHMAEKIIDYFGDGDKLGVNIEYFIEKEPLGNAGALFMMRERLDGDFLLLNADSVFDIDFNRFVEYHRKKGGLVTLFTHPNSHPYDSGLIISNKDGSVDQWLTKEDKRPEWYQNRVNAGLHVINAKILDMVDVDVNAIGKQVNWKEERHMESDFPGYVAIEKYYNGAAETTSSIVASLDAHCRYMKLECVIDLLSEDEIQIARDRVPDQRMSCKRVFYRQKISLP